MTAPNALGTRIEFIAALAGMDDLAAPVPARQATPEWFRQAPVDIPGITGDFGLPLRGMKGCPGIMDYLGHGFILPAWTDIQIDRKVTEEYGDNHQVVTGLRNDETVVSGFGGPAMQMPVQGSESHYAIKLESPWVVRTPPGWSVMILPLAYGRDQDFEVLPGIVDTDIMHQMHFVARLRFDGIRLIELGTPLLQVIPFERQRHILSIQHDPALHESLLHRAAGAPGSGKRMVNGGYRRWRRIFRERHGVQ